MSWVGINIGALTVKVVELRGSEKHVQVEPHRGDPLRVLKELVARPEFSAAQYFGVTGDLGHISEAAAIQRALRELPDPFDAVTSLGGESFLVYPVREGKIVNVLSHNKCAAGSGEFFLQQIGRMGLSLEEAIKRSFAGKTVPLASRCSVHCKSDITHKLNRKEANPEDILYTLLESMASKVASLLEKSQQAMPRVLVIGGVSRNVGMVAALRARLPKTEFVVLPESPWFEAWGCALLVQDKPCYRAPNVSLQPRLDSLPPLFGSAGQVSAIPPPAPAQIPAHAALVLGIDAGSTTTKAVLVDVSSRSLVASHYTRTRSDPVQATRECLRVLAEQVGNRNLELIATTGSARELVGAYLGTGHVFNEISAHAAGTAHFDPDVDTIFEIGGQDSKYIYLRHGVPIDYAMNNACSAGTGSFLEESAQGDLGIRVDEIASLALAATAPVQLKATCAAFINSDIRIAQQQGHSREDILAGLVYAIASNYLTKVKGSRPVGRRVSFQGGVALNRAVGHAFAQSLGRPVVIPPFPELLGALGVALLALRRTGDSGGTSSTEESGSSLNVVGKGAHPSLLSLAAPDLMSPGRFTCGACQMRCRIDRFEVVGRRFPFGGRCSLFEGTWKRKARTKTAPDLVEQRAAWIFGTRKDRSELRSEADSQPRRLRIGIPRALTTHFLYPLYSTFFERLGLEPVLSGVDSQGDLKAYSSFCFPAQVAHGAVLDLIRSGVKVIFVPHVVRMQRTSACRDSYLCPVTQAGPYFLAKAFPEVRLLSPLLDFTRSYESSGALKEMAGGEWGLAAEVVEQAWSAAVRVQTEAELALQRLGQEALRKAIASGEATVLLAGRSYTAYTPEVSQSVGKKISSMGMTAIPADCLAPVGQGPMAWHFSNQILNALALVEQHANLFLVLVSNFSCTLDAFTHAQVASETSSKPYLILEIDAHTADAGVQTRLEAFLDIIANYQKVRPVRLRPFTPCHVGLSGQVVRQTGECVSLGDPRVRLYFPNFSQYHAQALAMAVRWLGLQPGRVRPLDRSQLELGLRYTSGRECLPLPICIGQLLQIHQQRLPREIAGFYMLRGGAPCVADAYRGYLTRFIAEQRLPDLFSFVPAEENNYLGFGKLTLAKHTSPALLLADILVEIDHVLRVVGAEGAVNDLWRESEWFMTSAASLSQFHAQLPALIEKLRRLPRQRNPMTCARVVVTGDFFTRFSPFFMEGVRDRYAGSGIILKPVDLNDLLLYSAYHSVAETASAWGLKPGGVALAKACTRILQPDGKKYLQNWLAYQAEKKAEQHYRGLFQNTGLLVAGANEPAAIFDQAAQHVSPRLFGEVIPTVGQGLEAQRGGYDGIIIVGPFNCLPFRISEAILKPLSLQCGIPVLTYESDGYAVSPSILRQVSVHIQQVLEHADSSRSPARPPQ
jgi:predicted CoA-substrate-specific enzyme activase